MSLKASTTNITGVPSVASLCSGLRAAPTRRGRRNTVAVSASLHAELDLQAMTTSMDAALNLYGGAAVPELEETLRHLLHIADTALAAAESATGNAAAAPQDNGWLSPLVDGLEFILRSIQSQLDRLNTPYSYGWSIVALTAVVKLATYPLTKQQVESSLAMQSLKPEIDAIKAKYGEDKDAVQRETSALYEKANVNPLAGCLPSIATIPIFIGLYRSLTAVASTGDLDGQGFYWIPSLAGPTSVAAQKAGTGTAWLLPLVDGAPPSGWDVALPYLYLPVALVVAQWISSAIVSPPVDPNSENANVQKALVAGLPLMIGWFALNVPSGLSLYYFSNTVFTSAIQIYLKKLGGAKSTDFDLGPVGLGKARRTGTVASASESMDGGMATAPALVESSSNGNGAASTSSVVAMSNGATAVQAVTEAAAVPTINKRCKRRRRELLEA